MQKCIKCGADVADEDVYVLDGNPYCDDCSIMLSMQRTLRKCDPIAVHSAVTARKSAGQSGTEGLTSRQKEIYDFIEKNGGATVQQITEQFDMPGEEVDIALTVLRHVELCKGEKRADGVYMVLW
ncbi:MAG: hypothetical protein ACC608_02690 [Anaerofustis sp.]